MTVLPGRDFEHYYVDASFIAYLLKKYGKNILRITGQRSRNNFKDKYSIRTFVISALILHKDNKVKHSRDVKEMIENRLYYWSAENFTHYLTHTEDASNPQKNPQKDNQDINEEDSIQSLTKWVILCYKVSCG